MFRQWTEKAKKLKNTNWIPKQNLIEPPNPKVNDTNDALPENKRLPSGTYYRRTFWGWRSNKWRITRTGRTAPITFILVSNQSRTGTDANGRKRVPNRQFQSVHNARKSDWIHSSTTGDFARARRINLGYSVLIIVSHCGLVNKIDNSVRNSCFTQLLPFFMMWNTTVIETNICVI